MNDTKSSFVTTREAKKVLQVSEATLRRWADEGLCPSIRSPGGKRLYNVQQFLSSRPAPGSNTGGIISEEKREKESICYCRVSSQGQKDDLQRQIAYMQTRFPSHRIISDVESGINFKRKGLRTILELAAKGMVSEVVVAYRDRLCRFAFELISWMLQINGVKLLVLNEGMDHGACEPGGQAELAEDLLAIINVFNCRVNGKRKYGGKGDSKGPKTESQKEE